MSRNYQPLRQETLVSLARVGFEFYSKSPSPSGLLFLGLLMTANVAKEFNSARLLMTRARENAQDLHARSVHFFQSEPAAKVIEIDTQTGEQLHILRMVKEFPPILETVAADAINSLPTLS